MSGGHFDYDQYRIENIAESIQSEIDKSGRKKTPEELDTWHDKEYYEKYPDELYFYRYSDATIEEFRKAIKYLRIGAIYAQRVDYLLSGDDGEETFHKRLEEDLKLNEINH